MSVIKHDFTATIITILNTNTNGKGEELLKTSGYCSIFKY
jgi:hypothetical protein